MRDASRASAADDGRMATQQIGQRALKRLRCGGEVGRSQVGENRQCAQRFSARTPHFAALREALDRKSVV